MVENFSQCSCVTTMLDMRTSTTINGRYKEFGDYLQTMHTQHRGLLYFKAKGKRSFQTSTAIPLPFEFLRIPRNFRQ